MIKTCLSCKCTKFKPCVVIPSILIFYSKNNELVTRTSILLNHVSSISLLIWFKKKNFTGLLSKIPIFCIFHSFYRVQSIELYRKTLIWSRNPNMKISRTWLFFNKNEHEAHVKWYILCISMIKMHYNYYFIVGTEIVLSA